jgi:hypothetical protein
MGFTLDQLAEKAKKSLFIEFEDGDKFNYAVSVNRMTFPMMSRLEKASQTLGDEDDTLDNRQEAVGVMMELLIDWDLVDEKGRKLPINKDNALKLPLAMLLQMINDTMEAVTPNEESATSSSGGSKTQE